MRDFYEVCTMIEKDMRYRYRFEDAGLFPATNRDYTIGVINNSINRVIGDIGDNEVDMPSWYKSISLEEAAAHELYGLGCLSEWLSPNYADSNQIYTTGENVFIVRDGHSKLMNQRITKEVKDRILKAPNGTRVAEGITLYHTDDGEILLDRVVTVNTTKQDLALSVFNMLIGAKAVTVEPEIFKRVAMRKTNSMEVELLDGRQFKIIIKNIGEED